MLAWRSNVSASRRFFLSLSLFSLICTSAAADKPKVGLVPFEGGPQAARAAKVVYNALKDRVELVGMPAGSSPGGKKRKGKGKGKQKGKVTASTAAAPPVAAVITGALVPKKSLFISVKSTSTGKVEKLAYPVKGPKIDYAVFEQLASQIAPAVEAALGSPLGSASTAATTPDKTPGGTATPGPSAPQSDREVPPGLAGATGAGGQPGQPAATAVKAAEPAQPKGPGLLAQKPSWAPVVDASISFLLSGRNFAFSEAGTPSFKSYVNPGLRLDATLYPFAVFAGRGKAGWRALGGLGVGATADLVFWPASVAGDGTPANPCAETNPNGSCKTFGTSEYRVEGGLRWRWNLFGSDDRPSLLALAEYGTHHFGIARRTNPGGGTEDVGPPDVSYQYVTVGLGARVPFKQRFSVTGLIQIHALIDQGPIQSTDEYGQFGKGGGYGLRATLGFDARVWRGLFVGVGGFYERFSLSFVPPPAGTMAYHTPPCPCATTGSAADQYYGATLTVGYRY